MVHTKYVILAVQGDMQGDVIIMLNESTDNEAIRNIVLNHCAKFIGIKLSIELSTKWQHFHL